MVYYLSAKAVGEYLPKFRILDGDPAKIEMEDMTPESSLIMLPGSHAVTSGRRIKTEHVPTRIQWQSRQPVPDVDNPHGILAVSDKFKDIVERLEPGVHQFLPVEFVDEEGKFLANRSFFIVGSRIDSVDRERTTFYLKNGLRWRADGVDNPRLVFNNAAIGGRHAWVDKFLYEGIRASDVLAEALQNAHFTGISLELEESV